MTGPVDAVQDLSEAFAARDLGASLACFAAGDDIGYAGSEKARPRRAAVSVLLGEVFGRPEAYGWTTRSATMHRHGTQSYVFAEADGVARTDAGELKSFPYRVSGVVELTDGRWRWRHCKGSEPAA
jgi:SnoaL-like protein